jgi:hypothetical protein
MDRVYTHVTTEMREQLCAVLEDLWNTALEQRRAMSGQLVPVLNGVLAGREGQPSPDAAIQARTRRSGRLAEREAEP